MSPHGDLIEFGGRMVVVVGILIGAYFALKWQQFKEAVRHNRAVERANWRLYWQIRRLGDCDGRER